MRVERVWLTDFRNYASLDVTLAPGLTAVVGANGQGKTNMLEALGWLATLDSFRGAVTDTLIRAGADRAILRAEGDAAGRRVLIEAELNRNGRHRVQVNRQRLTRARDLLGVLRTTVFTPDDLDLIKGGPGVRRGFLDTTLVAIDTRRDTTLREMEKILRQRNALLRQVGGRLDESARLTLDVWDEQLSVAGEAVADARAALVATLEPEVEKAYGELAATSVPVHLGYHAPWRSDGLAAALASHRKADLARAVSTVGPHRDEVVIALDGMAARACASQGEQRCLALALKLAAHRLVGEAAGSPPLLLLDDVFSELDPNRCEALLRHLPTGQALLTSADRLPAASRPERVYRVDAGTLAEVAFPLPETEVLLHR
jgi:DNA replication and repair protein RecF